MNLKVLSVSDLNNYLRKIIESDFVLKNIQVKGEISNFKAHSSGHLYFSIKDAGSRLDCVMFRQDRQGLKALPKDGDSVTLKGRISVYVQGGKYQLYVQEISMAGKGNLYLQFNEIKERLAKEGLFDPTAKRPIPQEPEVIGVITSPTGAAVRDIIKVMKTRNPRQRMVIFPALVQGEGSSKDLIRALEQAQGYDLDVIILSRGGGSMEDLWSFNSEELARRIRASRIPVVSGVGHDVDFTIADFAADLRAATPSQAAELTIPDTRDRKRQVAEGRRRLKHLMDRYLANSTHSLTMHHRLLKQRDPRLVLANEVKQVMDIRERLTGMMNHRLDRENHVMERAKGLLSAYNPLNILDKGYAILQDEAGKVLSQVAVIEKQPELFIRVKDGETIFRKGK